MSYSQFTPESLNHIVAMWLILALLAHSFVAWTRLVQAVRQGQPALGLVEEPRAAWTSFAEVSAVAIVIMMIIIHLAPRYLPAPGDAPKAVPLNLLHVLMQLVMQGGMIAMLPAILACGPRPLSEYGFKWRGLLEQLRDGWNGFSLALLPTALMLLMTSALRSRENQNPLLTLLADSPDIVTMLLIGVTAVVAAPLHEEMMFRVVFQGWLTSRLGSQLGILITALCFAAIHGPIDGIALAPLAAILGTVFDRRRSYLSVVVIHGLFNATMLILALLTQTPADAPPMK